MTEPQRDGGTLAVEGCIRYAYMLWRCESKPVFLFNIFVCEITPPSPPLKGEASVFVAFVSSRSREGEDVPSVPESDGNRCRGGVAPPVVKGDKSVPSIPERMGNRSLLLEEKVARNVTDEV